MININKTIYQYTRDRRTHQLNGVVLAVGKNQVGWSKCAKGDNFSKRIALEIALARACEPKDVPVPFSIKNEYNRMIERSQRYYKQLLA